MKHDYVDPEKRYTDIMKNSASYMPVPDDMLQSVPKPALDANDWGIGVIGHWVKTANNASHTCLSEEMRLYMIWSGDQKHPGGTYTEPVIYLAGKGWFFHKRVLEEYDKGFDGLEKHIRKCVESYNGSKKEEFNRHKRYQELKANLRASSRN
ncbi:MAG: hypothetical protein JXQ77_05635 [Campylobacterales bacterium]|nr:hypothetical protein [Campylobacterales bacterium]